MNTTPTIIPLQGTSELATPETLAVQWKYAKASMAPNTERALRTDLKLFTNFCTEHGVTALPATPETVVAFLETVVDQYAMATLRRIVSSIATFHKIHKFPNPAASVEVKMTLRGMARTKGTRQRQASPINWGTACRMRGAERGTLRDTRDVAMLGVAYDTLCRRSEIAALDVADFTFAENGTATVLVRKSKTDKEGAGSVRFIAADTVRLLKQWIVRAKVTQGAMFRGVDNADVVGERLSDKGVARALHRLAVLAKVDADGISGHSCRVGAAQDMVGEGLEIGEIMQAGGWKSPMMVARYSENQAASRGAAAKLAKRQGRG